MAEPSTRTIARHARYGLILFVIYVLFYAAFVYLCAFKLETMKHEIGGVNLAVLYGLGLIVAAFVLALLYMLLCRRRADDGTNVAEDHAP